MGAAKSAAQNLDDFLFRHQFSGLIAGGKIAFSGPFQRHIFGQHVGHFARRPSPQRSLAFLWKGGDEKVRRELFDQARQRLNGSLGVPFRIHKGGLRCFPDQVHYLTGRASESRGGAHAGGLQQPLQIHGLRHLLRLQHGLRHHEGLEIHAQLGIPGLGGAVFGRNNAHPLNLVFAEKCRDSALLRYHFGLGCQQHQPPLEFPEGDAKSEADGGDVALEEFIVQRFERRIRCQQFVQDHTPAKETKGKLRGLFEQRVQSFIGL